MADTYSQLDRIYNHIESITQRKFLEWVNWGWLGSNSRHKSDPRPRIHLCFLWMPRDQMFHTPATMTSLPWWTIPFLWVAFVKAMRKATNTFTWQYLMFKCPMSAASLRCLHVQANSTIPSVLNGTGLVRVASSYQFSLGQITWFFFTSVLHPREWELLQLLCIQHMYSSCLHAQITWGKY